MAVLAAVVGAGACGSDGDNDDEAIEDVIRAAVQAWNDQDFDAFKTLHTEAGLKAQLEDAEDPDTEAGLREAFGLFTEDKEVIDKIGDINVDGDKATAYVEAYQEAREDPAFAAIVLGVNASFVKDGEDWKIDGLEFVSPEKPDGATSVHIDANEFAFGFNPEDITSGKVSFEIANVGKQPHHFVLEQIPDDLDIETALQSEEDPEGAVHIGATPPWDPGKTYNIVFTADLEPGRYVMLCFMPDTDDPEGTPHAFKGMYKDFRIE